MARYFITGFSGGSGGNFGVTGQLIDHAIDVDLGLSVDSIPTDPTSSTSVRQQIQSGLVAALNAQVTAANIPLTLIATDIEFVC
jgi:hypothetical protein